MSRMEAAEDGLHKETRRLTVCATVQIQKGGKYKQNTRERILLFYKT
jgi:hypothetical protein